MKRGVVLAVFAVLAIVIFGFYFISLNGEDKEETTQESDVQTGKDTGYQETPGEGQGQDSDCSGSKAVFGFPPVNLEKTKVVVPLGLMSGNHITPVDHQYFQDFDNTEADIEVYSPGDGVIKEIQHMTGSYYDSQRGENVEWADYRIVIEHDCEIAGIYIHIDRLSEKISNLAPEKGGYAGLNLPVEAGEVIGWYSTNVDYNLVDENYVRPGLLVPEHYESEPWKIHVPDTLEYFNEEIQSKIIEKSLRTEEPISGKFDYDIDGRLIGNWFEENTNGYSGRDQNTYWKTHLSIAPNYIDSGHIIVSMGDYDGGEIQLGVRGNSPDPAEVSIDSGMIKYELVNYDYKTPGGDSWDRRSLVKNLKAENYEKVQGVIVLQLLEDRKLKVEIFPEKTGNEVQGFTDNANFYER